MIVSVSVSENSLVEFTNALFYLFLLQVKKATNRVHHDSIVPVNVASSSSH